MKIKDIPLNSRPMERMEKYGIKYLSDSEILAILIHKGTKNYNAIDISNNIIGKYGMKKLLIISLNELQSIKGIGKVKAMQIMASIELTKRLMKQDIKKDKVQIRFAYQVYKHMESLAELQQEHFIALMLNTKNRIIKEDTVCIGTLDTTLVHPREIFRNAIKESASSIILVHNHPSGDPTPSEDDIKITEEIYKAGEILRMPVLDHIIIGRRKYWSWRESK
jgi:DNA repair protein RadC